MFPDNYYVSSVPPSDGTKYKNESCPGGIPIERRIKGSNFYIPRLLDISCLEQFRNEM